MNLVLFVHVRACLFTGFLWGNCGAAFDVGNGIR